MPTRFLRITCLQDEPIDIGTKDSGRGMFAFNVLTHKVASATYEKELVRVIQTAALGTWGTDLFDSSSAVIPDGDGPYVSVRSTGGAAGLQVQEEARPKYHRATAQIVVQARISEVAKARAVAVHDALATVVNQDITPVS